MKRDLFVFSGQSNMMGASVFPPKTEITLARSFEYKHKARRLGAQQGEFSAAVYPIGEFSYKDMAAAYASSLVDATGKSRLKNYIENTYFCPSMSNLKSEEERTVHSFSEFSEATAVNGASLAPFLAWQWERCGEACAYAHIAKGGVSIDYFLTDEMAAEYARRIRILNRERQMRLSPQILENGRMPGAADYFFEKCKHFFEDAEARFSGDEMKNKCFFWLQGEADVGRTELEYEVKLDILWSHLRQIGFTHFFCLRVGFFGTPSVSRVMKAQENFVSRHEDAYMLTRAASYFVHPENGEDWFITPPDVRYLYCRDSFYGFSNQHINEKGFFVLAEDAVKNLYRVLVLGGACIPEEENVRALLS